MASKDASDYNPATNLSGYDDNQCVLVKSVNGSK